ncbi:MAG: L,D-transpeptidase family protein, partial [Chitinophagaceae bacterium]
MKTIILSVSIIIIAFCTVSCNNSPGKPVDNGEKNSRSTRDYSITSANSYSDLFLDSNQVEKFITNQHLDNNIADDMRSFYNARNFEFAWFNSDGLTEQALSFRSLYDFDSTDSKKILDRSLDSLMIEDTLTIAATDASSIKTELLFTWRFINYITAKYPDQSAKQAALKELIPAKKQGTLAMADAVLAASGNESIIGESYIALRNQLKRYADAAKSGGWQTLPLSKKKIKQNTSDSLIQPLKKRLQQTSELATSDTSNIFTPELGTAIRKFQQEHGLKTDGAISQSLIKQLNVSALERTQQILINLERMRWMPSIAKGRTILVNIPEYILHVFGGNDPSFNMDIVVGKEGHSTVMFTGNLDQVVFSPYWNLPPDIIRKEVLPSIKKDNHYLEEHDMEVTGEENGLPVIRQLPGDKNELGKVKFLFPNSFNIYFHDTPHKELFNNNERAFSHGCIRLREPAKMASFLLKDQPEWTADRIDEAMNSGKEKFVRVKDPVPVLIYYYTAWIDDQNTLQWRED